MKLRREKKTNSQSILIKKNWEEKRRKEKKTYMSMEDKISSWGEKRSKRNGYWSFLYMGKKKKKKKKGDGSVVKLDILDFLLEHFTDE